MKTQGTIARSTLLANPSIPCRSGHPSEVDLPENPRNYQPFLVTEVRLSNIPVADESLAFAMKGNPPDGEGAKQLALSMNFGEFVFSRFVPEYVAIRKAAGRSHFRAILKYVLPPEQVARAFTAGLGGARLKLKAIPDLQYMDTLRLSEITPERVQHHISTALSLGYSIQTVTHIRNVIRTIFVHATQIGLFSGVNPATGVKLPAMARREAHLLTLTQLKQVVQAMSYPEKNIVLFALLTEMNVAEVCGLQWRYVNLSNDAANVDEETIPSRTIAVRKQSYRGEFRIVTGSRSRFVPMPDLLCSILRDLKNRGRFSGPEDFVLASRNGTPIIPENLASRRLKSIGKALEMPWLSWYVFRRTRTKLRSQFGRHLHRELENVLPLDRVDARRPIRIVARRPSQTLIGN